MRISFAWIRKSTLFSFRILPSSRFHFQLPRIGAWRLHPSAITPPNKEYKQIKVGLTPNKMRLVVFRNILYPPPPREAHVKSNPASRSKVGGGGPFELKTRQNTRNFELKHEHVTIQCRNKVSFGGNKTFLLRRM